MSDGVGNYARAGTSTESNNNNNNNNTIAAADRRSGQHFAPTGIGVLDVPQRIGGRGETYEEEYQRLMDYVKKTADLTGPAAPVLFANYARALYKKAKEVAANKSFAPYDKCVLLFHIFDALVLVFKNISLVRSDIRLGVSSVFGYSNALLKTMLSRVERMTKQVAAWLHDAHSLAAINSVMATAEQRLSLVKTEADMLEFFRHLSGSASFAADSVAAATSSIGGGASSSRCSSRLPRGVELYTDPNPESSALLERLYTTNRDANYIREFHDCMFLIATGNTQTTLRGALETRLADKDRNVVLFDAPGDRLFASSMCASAIGFLRKKLRGGEDGTAATVDRVETYRINYGRIFSKYRGDSERNFDEMMEWTKNKVRASDKLRVFWFPDIENLMSPRTSSDQEHIAAIKNSMLQHMDAFNKDRTLRSFLLLFHSSEGALDSAFSRRLETVIRTPISPLIDRSVAVEAVGAELARYRINLTDQLREQIAVRAGRAYNDGDDEERAPPAAVRVGGFAQVQATLRDMYVNQKLVLSHDVRAVETRELSPHTLNTIFGRYVDEGSRDTLYDLADRPMETEAIDMIAFEAATVIGRRFANTSRPRKYNAAVRGDPKDITGLDASRTLFLHDVQQ